MSGVTRKTITVEAYKRIYDDTQKHASEYDIEQSEKVLDDVIVFDRSKNSDSMRVLVIHENPFSAAIDIWNRCIKNESTSKYKIGIVQCANQMYPVVNGEGGAAIGAQGFEYELLRISNLNVTLDGNFYPMLDGVIVCPTITIFKSPSPDYNYVENPTPVTAFFLPCQRRPDIISIDSVDEYLNANDKKKMQQQIDNIFILAQMYGINTLIISDFGTDIAHEHPIKKVIEMFNDALKKYRVSRVIFAIKRSPADAESDKVFMQYHTGILRHV